MVFTLLPIIFFIAILCVAFEDKIKINKSAIMIISSVVLWSLLLIDADSILGSGLSEMYNNFAANIPAFNELPAHERYTKFLSEFAFLESLGEVTTTLFFVIGSMTIVELIDAHGGFNVISNRLKVNTKRKFAWLIAIVAFVLSMVLDDLATAIIMVAILRTFISDTSERWIYSSLVIIACNAGGACSPIGDVTTILLWTGGNLTPLHQISTLLIPSLVNMCVAVLMTMFFIKKGDLMPVRATSKQNSHVSLVHKRFKTVLLVMGVVTLAFVPVFNEITGLPPFMGVMGGLAVMWFYTDVIYNNIKLIKEGDRKNIQNLLTRIDMSTILFFFGVLMSVSALKVAGTLGEISGFLDSSISNTNTIAIVLGIVSSFLDNVALVAATMGMYPLADAATVTDPHILNYVVNSEFWTLIAYCCVTGGSILIIGSATGVSVMGMEKITFGYYLKRFTLIALVSYFAGVGAYMLIA